MCSLAVVLRDARAVSVQNAKIELRDAVALLRGFAIPLDRLGVIPQHALAALVQDAQVELRLSVALLGQRMPEPERCCVITASIRGKSIL